MAIPSLPATAFDEVFIEKDVRKIRKALERGELVTVMAKVRSGWIDPESFEKALEEHAQKKWPNFLFRALLEK